MPFKIIDADTHLTEPHDLWTKRAPAHLKDRVPQVKMLDGQMSWVIGGDQSIGTGAHPNSSILKQGGKVRDLDKFLKLKFDDVHLGSSSVKERLAVMDEAGVYAQIVYPNILGFGGQASARVDPELRLACVQIYNDAMAELQAESGQRLFPMALLPWWMWLRRSRKPSVAGRWACAGSTSIPIRTWSRTTTAIPSPTLEPSTGSRCGRSARRATFPSTSTSAPAKRPSTGWGSRAGPRCRAICARAFPGR
jgi:hypothetical protein